MLGSRSSQLAYDQIFRYKYGIKHIYRICCDNKLVIAKTINKCIFQLVRLDELHTTIHFSVANLLNMLHG